MKRQLAQKAAASTLKKKLKQGSSASSSSSEQQSSVVSGAEKKMVEISWFDVPLINEVELAEDESETMPFMLPKVVIQTEKLPLNSIPKDGLEILKKPKSKHSKEQGKQMVDWIFAPINAEQLYEEYFEKRVLVIKRNHLYADYYRSLYSLDEIKQVLANNKLKYSYDLDLALYRNGRRFTLNPNKDEIADPDLVWDLYENMKCSVRMLRPQEQSDVLLSLLCHFEEYFGQGAGLNAYLTPAGSQGFAPHYDDIEAILIQLEGVKHWKIYRPLNNEQFLSRFSSKNFTQEEVKDFECFEVVLKPGDLLYIPKGIIHQAVTSETEHSLHVTISTSHLMSWCDYFEKALPMALSVATANHVEFRKALPKDFKEYMGTNIAESDDPRRDGFIETCSNLTNIISQYLPIDQAADEMVKKFMHDRHVVDGLTILNTKKNAMLDENTDILSLSIKLKTANCAHIVIDDLSKTEQGKETESKEEEQESEQDANDDDDDVFSIIYATQNTRIYHEVELQHLDLDGIFLEAMQLIFSSYPSSVPVSELPNLTDDEKVTLVQQLLNEGIVETEMTSP
ncbi:hypothetical protein C9374_007429 [Naegleria lovaniensis]|uniref:Bifunctional lysine-specific demethylase and histidyl-hydroxylase n=1 Tax=Naegleria lovaniensis TaxID=51637 RepID=A0AA88GLZ0_NAELO|nr:uncharacterized protein C9374_007429 [Naegleria lovaniensis]KAG2379290.1 hypothetical protein C9374_007429 [Naegleria lovaniensis]